MTTITHHWNVRRVALVGAGKRAAYGADLARRVAAAGVLAARQRRVARVAILFRAAAVPSAPAATVARLVQAAAEGIVLAQHDIGRHKSAPPELAPVADVRLVAPELAPQSRADATKAVERGAVLGSCTNLARDLGNEPANLLTPCDLRRASAGRRRGHDARGRGPERGTHRARSSMGLLLGVSRGSIEPPRVIVLRHDPPEAPASPVLALVGKGVTFDSGGISIKPADGMEKMKVDMAGGAAVIARAARRGAAASADSRDRHRAVHREHAGRPRGRSRATSCAAPAGKTVEVVNTDAEGRLILGDGLWYAREQGATHLVDVATLTGACVVALGRLHSGIFGAPDDFVDARRPRRPRDRRSLLADAVNRRLFRTVEERRRRHEQYRRTSRRGSDGRRVPEAVRRRSSLGARRHRRHRLGRRGPPWQVKGATGVAVRLLAEMALEPESWRHITR